MAWVLGLADCSQQRTIETQQVHRGGATLEIVTPLLMAHEPYGCQDLSHCADEAIQEFQQDGLILRILDRNEMKLWAVHVP